MIKIYTISKLFLNFYLKIKNINLENIINIIK